MENNRSKGPGKFENVFYTFDFVPLHAIYLKKWCRYCYFQILIWDQNQEPMLLPFRSAIPSIRCINMFGCTAQKMKISIKDFFTKCGQIRRKLQIWPHLLKKCLMENFIFWCIGNTSIPLLRLLVRQSFI